MYSIYRLKDNQQQLIASGLTIKEASALADKILKDDKETALLIEKNDERKENNDA